MKRILITTLIITTAFMSCKKDEAEIPADAFKTKANFYNVSTDEILFIPGQEDDQSITFDIFISDPVPQDISVTIGVDPSSTAEATTLYELSATQLTILKDSLSASASIVFHYDGIDLGDTKELMLIISNIGENVIVGLNDTLEISILKGTLFEYVYPGDWWAHNWGNEPDIGNYDEGWGSDVTLTFVEGSTMTMNNLWWGGEDITVFFNEGSGEIEIADDQVIDAGWETDGFTPPWYIRNVSGTYHETGPIMRFYYEVWDSGNQLYSGYNCWIDE